MAKLTASPMLVPLQLPRALTEGVNDAAVRDIQRQESKPAEMPYTRTPDQGLASRRSKHFVRTHAEVEAATTGEPSLAAGISLRMPMAGQCENDQFIYSTDAFGKQRS